MKKNLTFVAVFATLLLLGGCATTSVAVTGPETVSGEIQLTVFGLSCPLCASNLTDALNRVDGVTEVWGDLDTGNIHILLEEGREIPSSAFVRAVRDAGFTLQNIHSGEAP